MSQINVLLCRTDEDFLTYHLSEHSVDDHIPDPFDRSPFLDIDFPMVTGFVVDSMYSVIAGAFMRRIEGFAFVESEGKLRHAQIEQVSQRLKYYRSCRPSEFRNYVSQLLNCRSYKTHEARQLLYYLVYPAFIGILDRSELDHAMLLQYGMLLLGAYNYDRVS